MPIQITAKRDGFRRCGMAHSDKTQTYADDHFSAAQLQVLEAEDQLVVVRLSDQELAVNSTDISDQLLSAQQKIDTLTDNLQTTTEQLTAANAQVEKLNGDLSQATADLTAKQETIAAQAAEIETLKAQVVSLTPADDKTKK
ncbi:HI1506-related protein [Obesumbacterium proteus]|uniref:Chromosome segregation ATPase n=1 Tax=Obesumbacterium proteus ATCC 12841 TaxID=1354268 RepID=A0AA91EI15_9GAMM|nr:HI1506-related protein [Obesumbacterium proteus]AMO79719.1 hypothetical protein DSM2777_00760 [Obesumbacterium proteus]OAT58982.1 chromosome segregation ATPase [Obesumbacterium proteus ATCC 12841]